MKTLLQGFVALAALVAVPAAAADIPAKAPSPAVICCEWTGFYIGLHGGYGWKDNPFREFLDVNNALVPMYIGGIKSKGWLYGGHLGYNWQKGWFVGGVELDMSGTGIKGDALPVAFVLPGGGTQSVAFRRSDAVAWLGSLRGRLGLAPRWDCCSSLLLYATGGPAWERFQRINTTTIFGPGAQVETGVTTVPNDRFGWVLGGGVEARLFGSDWLLRLEYLHYEFGTSQTSQVIQSNGPVTTRAEQSSNQRIDVVRGGLSYKF